MNSMNHTMRSPGITCRAEARQRGFSLVELMVSMIIGLVILAALVALFVNTSGSNREMARANALIENGRLAMQLLEGDVAHAGYWGGYVPQYDDFSFTTAPTDVPDAIPDPCLAYDVAAWDAAYVRNLVGVPVQVYGYESPPAVCAAVIDSPLAGTDVLIVRHAELCVPDAVTGYGTCESDDPAGRLYFQVSRCGTDVERYVFGTDNFVLRKRDCAELADKRKFVSDIYYVRDYAVTAGDGIPTLMRSSFDLAGGVLEHQPAVPLVEGVEGFHVELGVDDVSKTGDDVTLVDLAAEIDWEDPDTRDTATNRGDGSPDGDYLSCTAGAPCELNDFVNTTAVKIYMLVRSRETTPGQVDDKTYDLGGAGAVTPGGEFARHLFVSTVRLPNIAGRRETP